MVTASMLVQVSLAAADVNILPLSSIMTLVPKWAFHCSINGDNKFLDEKLAQLRLIAFRSNAV